MSLEKNRTSDELKHRKETAREQSLWTRMTGHIKSYVRPAAKRDPSAAPLGTDQEAGGAVTTPTGKRKYD